MVKRDKDDIEDIIQNDSLLTNYRKAFFSLTNEVVSNLSSTYVRKKIKERKSVAYLVPEEVITYISKNKLYL